jgi:hypothetical protein
VSCLAENAAGELATFNSFTREFPASKAGDSNIDARVRLPEDCVAPIVFVIAGSELASFAITGGEIGG